MACICRCSTASYKQKAYILTHQSSPSNPKNLRWDGRLYSQRNKDNGSNTVYVRTQTWPFVTIHWRVDVCVQCCHSSPLTQAFRYCRRRCHHPCSGDVPAATFASSPWLDCNNRHHSSFNINCNGNRHRRHRHHRHRPTTTITITTTTAKTAIIIPGMVIAITDAIGCRMCR